MARRGLLQHLRIDPTVGWVALLLGVAALYLYLRDRGRRDAAARQGEGGGAAGAAGAAGAGDAAGPTSYVGWKVLVNLAAARDPAAPPGGGVAVDPSQVETLRHLAGVCDLYTVLDVAGDDDEKACAEELERVGLFSAGLARHKLLFCSTVTGLKAIGRQLKPSILLEPSREVVDYLAPHLPHVGYIAAAAGDGAKPLRPNTIVAGSVAAYFAALVAQ